ncbi:MAG: tetratricopeptide repeat protein [Marinoscillum sp.]
MTKDLARLFLLLSFFHAFGWANAQKSETIIDQQAYNQANSYYNEAIDFFDFGETEKALSKFSLAVGLNPNNSDYWFGRASCYYDLKQFVKAARDIETAIQMEPGQADYHYYAGNIYFHKGDFNLAIKNYTKSIEANSDPDIHLNEVNILFNRGVAQLNLKQYNEAESDFKLVLEKEPENVDATHNLAVCLLKQNKDSACSTFLKAKKLGSGNSGQYISRYCK